MELGCIVLLLFSFLTTVISVDECYNAEEAEHHDKIRVTKGACPSSDESRCFLMTYEKNGKKVYDARCSTESECNAKDDPLCNFLPHCKILRCCEQNLCNNPAVTTRFDVRLMLVVISAILVILKYL